jgi:hypothetical protein
MTVFGIFFVFILICVLMALIMRATGARQIGLIADLNSKLLANYGIDLFADPLGSLNLLLIADVFKSDGQIIKGNDIGEIINTPVPTRTPINGDSPTSQDPTETSVPTNTPIPTFTFTPTPTPTSSPTVTPKPSKTPTPTKTPKPTSTPNPTSTPSPQSIRPILECVEYSLNGTFTAHFGYKNPNSFPIEIDIGPSNHFDPGQDDQGQPNIFEPGRTSLYPNAEFTVVFTDPEIVWHLGDKVAVASPDSTPCELPTSVPTTQQDIDAPILSGGMVAPSPGNLTVCEIDVSITDLEVLDPAWSSGIEFVKAKYLVEGYSDYIYSEPFILCSGGRTSDGGWLGCYNGDLHIEIDPTWVPPAEGNFLINLYAKARDNVGLEGYLWLGEYILPASCGCQTQ